MMQELNESARLGAGKQLVMRGVLALALILLGLKMTAWWLTGSQAVFSDAAESVINLITGAFGLFSISLAAKPPDRDHPYGHGKIEFFAAGLSGALILAAAAGILREAVPALRHPESVNRLGLGLLLSAAAGLANCFAGAYLMRRGRRSSNMTLVGEGKHLLADTVTTAGVIVGLVAVRLTGWLVLDPIVACLVSVYIAWSGLGLLKEAAARLMDEADPVLLRHLAEALQQVRRPEWIEIHQLRAWVSGDRPHIDFHLTVPRTWNLRRAHDSQDELARALLAQLGIDGEALVHADPCTEDLCSSCSVQDCAVRSEPFSGTEHSWTLPSMVSHGSPD